MTAHSSYPDRIRSRADLRLFLDLDLRAHGIVKWSTKLAITRPEIRFQRALRRAEWSKNFAGAGKLLYAWHRIRLQRLSLLTGISIPTGVFGPGLSIAHYGSIVVNQNARVGAFCRIHSATNLGAYLDAAPTLGDFVYVGPGAVIYGPARLGDRVAVGANSVVSKDVPAGCTVVGAPAKILSRRDSTVVMPNWIKNIMSADRVSSTSDVGV